MRAELDFSTEGRGWFRCGGEGLANFSLRCYVIVPSQWKHWERTSMASLQGSLAWCFHSISGDYLGNDGWVEIHSNLRPLFFLTKNGLWLKLVSYPSVPVTCYVILDKPLPHSDPEIDYLWNRGIWLDESFFKSNLETCYESQLRGFLISSKSTIYSKESSSLPSSKCQSQGVLLRAMCFCRLQNALSVVPFVTGACFINHKAFYNHFMYCISMKVPFKP